MEAVPVQERKRAAARRALEEVRDGTVLGLGSGSTAEVFLEELAKRVRDGLRVAAVPSSKRVARLAGEHGVPLTTLEDQPHLAIAVDGADEIHLGSFSVIKGGGGSLVREKLVALATDREIIIADESKVVERLGQERPVPVAVVQFGWNRTAARLEELGCEPTLRAADDGSPFVTDDSHYVLDCGFGPIAEPDRLASRIKALVGVVEHGLFIGLVHEMIVATAEGVKVWETSGNPRRRASA